MVRKVKTIKRWPRWLGVMAMLVNLVIPLGQGMSTAAFAGGNSNGMPPLVICSAMGGIVQIPRDGDSQAPSNQPAPCSCAFCLNCRSACQKFVEPSVLTITLPKLIASIYPQGTDYPHIPGWLPPSHRQRAPPSFT